MRIEIDNQSVFLGTGSRLHEAGNPWIVFVHGAAMDHTVWTLPARFFARHGFNVVAPDLPGHGRSGGVALANITDMTDWLGSLLIALGCNESIVVGHSMGSLVAMDYACRQPASCSAIALLGPSMPMPVTDVLLDSAQENDAAAYDMANVWSHSKQAQRGANSNPGVWMFGSGDRLMNRSQEDAFHADLTACNEAKVDVTSILCPCLLIIGESDQMTPMKAGLSVASQLSDAKTITLSNCGHAMLAEQPNEVLDALSGFILPMAQQANESIS